MATDKSNNKEIILRPSKHKRDSDISMRKSAGWIAEPETVKRVQDLAGMIAKGMSRASVQEYAASAYKVGVRQARAYYYAALKYLQPEDEEEYRKGLIQANIERLEKIVEEGMKDNANLKVAKDAIAELNRMVLPSNNSITIAKNKEGEEIINITFDK